MGLDASVMCTCYARGLAAPAPEGLPIVLDGEYLTLDLPWEGHEPAHEAFDRWIAAACPHPRMEIADERISNWGGYRLFQQALEEIGWSHFPTLEAVLPENNGGFVRASESALCLQELDAFCARYEATATVLVDTTSGETIFEHVKAYGGVFLWAGSAGLEIGVDDHGFFVRRSDPPKDEIFRAMRVQQRARDDGAELVDLDTARNVTIPVRVTSGDRVPARMTVEHRRADAHDLEYILRPLRVVFRASVETGNPVRWE